MNCFPKLRPPYKQVDLNQSFIPNQNTLGFLLNFKGLSEQAVNAFRVMTAEGLTPSLVALNSLINAFGEDRRDVEAFSVLQYMKENVPAVYEEMIMSGCPPDRKARPTLRSALRYMKQTLRS